MTVIGLPNPVDHPEAYYSVVLGGVTSPGQVEISGAKAAWGWDQKKGKGASGSTSTFTGRAPGPFTLKFLLWRDAETGEDHLERFETEFRPRLDSAANDTKPEALTIYHPDLAPIRIESVTIKSIGARVYEGQGLWSISVEVEEYRKPKPVPAGKGTPKGAQGGPSDLDIYIQTAKDAADLYAKKAEKAVDDLLSHLPDPFD